MHSEVVQGRRALIGNRATVRGGFAIVTLILLSLAGYTALISVLASIKS